jgi:predicted metal-dependent phosphoesterase TrpH
VISVPHPFDVVRSKHWAEVDLEKLVPVLDAVETFNSRCTSDVPNRQAKSFARKHGLLETVGSDAHTLGEFGKATLRMAEFDDAESFKDVLRGAQHDTRLSPVFVHLLSTYAKIVKRINLSQSENKASH